MLRKSKLAFKFSILTIGLVIGIFLLSVYNAKGSREYESMVMFEDKIYVKTDISEEIYSYIYVGEIESSIDAEMPVKNFQANDNLTGCKIYVPLNRKDYIFVYHNDMYISYKDMSSDENISKLLNDEEYWGREYTDKILSEKEKKLLKDTFYSNYYGGEYVIESDETQEVVLLTDISDEIISKFENVFGNNVSYKKCNVPKRELMAMYEYISTYWESPILSDTSICKLLDSMVAVGIYDDLNVVKIKMINCTEKKIALFKEKIIDSKYVIFEDVDGFFIEE